MTPAMYGLLLKTRWQTRLIMLKYNAMWTFSTESENRALWGDR